MKTCSESGTVTATLTFFYDAEGTPYAMTCNDDVYYYIVDAQGNVAGLYSEDGLCGTYDYIRFYLVDGTIKSVDAFVGWATRIIGELLK